MNKSATREPVEPELALDDIQGIAVPGFFKPHQTLVYVRYARTPDAVRELKAFLADLAKGEITNGSAALADRRAHRTPAEARSRRRKAAACVRLPDALPTLALVSSTLATPAGASSPLVAIAFTYQGLLGLSARALALRGDAFKCGLAARSALLGDPVEAGVPGHPSTWVVGAPGKELDFMLVVAGDSRPLVRERAARLIERLKAFGRVESQEGDGLVDATEAAEAAAAGRRLDSHEHFGFADGISQPGIRGCVPGDPDDHVSERVLRPTSSPASALQGLPGQDLVWPGEFVIGYPKSGPDPMWPGAVDDQQPDWARNGSFLVYRRLQQDVGLFWRAISNKAAELKKLPGFAALEPESLAAHLVGRRRSGAPLSRLPGFENIDCPQLGSDKHANNDFLFDPPTPGPSIEYPQAGADPLGHACPLAAHIRKVNPRDGVSDVGGTSASCARRILRVGVPYGPPSEDPIDEPSPTDEDGRPQVDRGILFLCIQASIEEQFEFLQARWMNDEHRPGGTPGGHDMIAGRNPAGRLEGRRPRLVGDKPPKENDQRSERRRFTLLAPDGQQALVDLWHPTVTPTGGGYFFVPSLSAITEVLAR